jgi:cyclophilin family peptidyl-prolyl cis-trans isomerase
MARQWQVWLASLLCVAGLLGPSQPEAAGASSDKPGVPSAIAPWQGPAPHVLIETAHGKLTLELYPDVAPRTVARFVKLVQEGFYNGLTFHRIVPKFLIQGGDPAGDGTGGSGLPIPPEFSERKHGAGTVGMARLRDSDSADSQFYICLEPQPFLDGKYTAFGQVVDGLDVLPKIQEGDVMRKVTLKP